MEVAVAEVVAQGLFRTVFPRSSMRGRRLGSRRRRTRPTETRHSRPRVPRRGSGKHSLPTKTGVRSGHIFILVAAERNLDVTSSSSDTGDYASATRA